MIALGTYYADAVGKIFDIELSSGTIIRGITGDVRSNNDSDTFGMYNPVNGGIFEFIVDTDAIDETSRIMGDMSFSEFDGGVIAITEIKKTEDEIINASPKRRENLASGN
jgi:hypothetical protein